MDDKLRKKPRRGIVGAAACPDALEFHTRKPAWRKASPGGWCSAQRIKRDMTAGGSHTFSALAQRQLRRMRSKLKIITMGWYDAVIFDLIRHAKRRDTFLSRGRLFLCPGRLLRQFLALKCQELAGEACLAPTMLRRRRLSSLKTSPFAGPGPGERCWTGRGRGPWRWRRRRRRAWAGHPGAGACGSCPGPDAWWRCRSQPPPA